MFLMVACFGIDALSMPVVLSSILVARLFVIIFFFEKRAFTFNYHHSLQKNLPF
jgi:hypothetical protein